MAHGIPVDRPDLPPHPGPVHPTETDDADDETIDPWPVTRFAPHTPHLAPRRPLIPQMRPFVLSSTALEVGFINRWTG